MARKCRFTATSASSKRAVNTSSASRSCSRAGSVCSRRNSKRSNESWKRKDCSIRHERAAAEISEADRHRHFPERRGDSRYAQHLAPARARRRGADQSGARAGNRRRRWRSRRPSTSFPSAPTHDLEAARRDRHRARRRQHRGSVGVQ